MKTGRSVLLCLPLAVAAILGGMGTQAHAATLNVASYGVDNPGCGSASAPCRSLGMAIGMARAGDRIVVGPGRYGDLSGDGSFSGAGDEHPQEGCACVIRVDKRLTIESSAGAAATLIDAGPGAAHMSVVRIEAENTIFGTRDRGFTVTGSSPFSVAVFAVAPGVKVEANTATGTLDGFASEGLRVTFTGNTATGVRHGFGVSKGDNVLVGNVATGNVNGFLLHGANEIRGNVASGNSEIGFRLLDAAGSTFMGNLAVANDRDGLTLSSADGSQVRSNVFVANGQTGVRLLGLSTSAVALGQNNIFGNGVVPDSTTGKTNCGVVNELGGTQKAANNFWGSPSGPAGGPPANVPCNTTAGATPVDPVAVRPFPLSR